MTQQFISEGILKIVGIVLQKLRIMKLCALLLLQSKNRTFVYARLSKCQVLCVKLSNV